MKLKIYVLSFDVNFKKDASGHISLNPNSPIDAIYTRGRILDEMPWLPWASIRVDLKESSGLAFDEWTGDPPSPYTVYCIAIEARNELGNQSVVETMLTPKTQFPASMFGPIGQNGAMGGGYPSTLLSVERQIASDCRALYDKIRF